MSGIFRKSSFIGAVLALPVLILCASCDRPGTGTPNADTLRPVFQALWDSIHVPQKIYDSFVESMVDLCPQPVAEGIELTKVSDDGTSIVYEFTVDDNELDMVNMKKTAADSKKNMVDFLKADKTKRDVARMVFSNDRTIVYKYTGKPSKKTFSIEITADDLGKD